MKELSMLQWLRDQWRQLPKVDTYKADLSGKTVIVTGANVGLGLEAARHFARMTPAKLILACRNEAAGADALASIVKDTKCPNVEVWSLDLGSFDSVKAFADRFEKEGGGKIDLLIENAGLSYLKFTKDQDGWETNFRINYLGTVHLAIRLLPFLLKAAASPPTPRLVVVSSEAHYVALRVMKGDESVRSIGQPSDEARYLKIRKIGQEYCTSKLLSVAFNRALTAHIPSSSALTVNSVNPGLCHSAVLKREKSICLTIGRMITPLFARTTEVGSRTLVHAALSPDLNGVTGQYLNACRVDEPSDLVLGETGKAFEQRVWGETLEMLGQEDSKVLEIVQEYLNGQHNVKVETGA